MLAMVVNDNACCLNPLGVLESIASKLAPTDDGVRETPTGQEDGSGSKVAQKPRMIRDLRSAWKRSALDLLTLRTDSLPVTESSAIERLSVASLR